MIFKKIQQRITHVNKSLPPVDIYILIKYDDIFWVECKRTGFIKNQKDHILVFTTKCGIDIKKKVGEVSWIYP